MKTYSALLAAASIIREMTFCTVLGVSRNTGATLHARIYVSQSMLVVRMIETDRRREL